MSSEMELYYGPIDPSILPHLTISFGSIGMVFALWFITYEVSSNKYSRHLVKELLILTAASIHFGCGTMFLLLWVGIFV